jgi:lysozyme
VITWVGGGAAVLLVLAATVWALLPHYRPELRPGERYGVDVSAHQGTVDWPAVAADGISFAYLKASEGGDLVDGRFSANWAGAGTAGLDRGSYHFFTLCRPGAEQAAHFLSVMPPDPAALPPAVDLELKGNCSSRPTQEAFAGELRAFLDRVEHAWGRKVLIYTNDDFDHLYPVRVLGRSMWEALYYRRPADGANWTVWQVTSLASVQGVDGGVDLDLSRPQR